ncbi:hypothetical protein VOI54_01045 [Tamlana sp. 2201CG12-4]|uniref:hypothetical protein n=1 Tax=Tamlana sp. 2201CG12-4 TaxID=3112582 RepID=UPI002DB83C22|nr:hypothetical protein [Tamlana sp. 2201CG12-4]MEC3905593.1 hypothetical protein [Tamlana sp. 2201CG12-4]
MEPSKFDEYLREKLEKRTLEPTGQSWNKLSGRLNSQVEKQNKKPYWWLGLAASVIGILFVAYNMLDNKTKNNNSPEVVQTPEIIQQNEAIKVVVNKGKEKDDMVSEETAKNMDLKLIETLKPEKTIKNKIQPKTEVATVKTKVNHQDEDIQKIIGTPNKNLSFEEQKIQDVVAQVHALKDKNQKVTNADIDALLAEAQKEIALNRLYNETTGKVDANALLQDVENELDQSFRTKVFEAIKASYNTVKTAVAQRNE